MAGATPVGADVHVDRPLSNYAVRAFDAEGGGFISDQLLPVVPVEKQSDKYYVIEKGAFLRVHDTRRAPKTAANRVEFRVSSDSYYAENYALAADHAIEDIANADNAIEIRRNSTDLVVQGLRLDQERRIANLLTSISNVGSGVQLTGTDKWGDGGSDPRAAINTGHAFMRSQTGLLPNVAVIDWDTMMVVKRHPLLLDMYKYTSGGELNDGQLAEILGVPRVLVGRGIAENALEEGTSSMTNIWGNNVLLAHIGPATGLRSRTLAARMRWQMAGMPGPMQVVTSVENSAGSKHIEILEAGYFQDEKVVASDLGYVIQNTL